MVMVADTFAPRIGKLGPDATAMLVLAVVALVVRAFTGFGPIYGEWDAARLVVDAELWWKGGIRSAAISEYRFYVSPGYIVLAMALARGSDLLGVHVGSLMSEVNAVAAVAFPPLAYVLARRLTDRSVAFFGGLTLPFMPTVAWSGAYGFPSLLAVITVTSAAILYDRHLTGESRMGPRAVLGTVLALLVATALLKADMYLASAAFPALYVFRRGWNVRQLAGLCALLLVPPLISAITAKVLLADGAVATTYFAQYQDQYELHWYRAYTRSFVEGWMKAFGVFTALVAAVGGLRLLVERRWWLALTLSLWAAGPFGFWYFRVGDSMRHHVPESVPMAICVGLVVTMARARPWMSTLAVVAILSGNYLRYPANNDYYSPSGRIFGSLEIQRNFAGLLQHFGDQFAARPENRKVLLGTIGNPYAAATLLREARRVDYAARGRPMGYDEIEHRIVRGDGTPVIFTTVRVNAGEAPAAAERYAALGYTVFSFEYDLAQGKARDLRGGTELDRFPPP